MRKTLKDFFKMLEKTSAFFGLGSLVSGVHYRL